MSNTCDTCQYWDSQSSGRCRRNAPSPSFVREGVGIWPSTNHDDWCGEYSDKRPVLNTNYQQPAVGWVQSTVYDKKD